LTFSVPELALRLTVSSLSIKPFSPMISSAPYAKPEREFKGTNPKTQIFRVPGRGVILS
jgi:hypothetical protein